MNAEIVKVVDWFKINKLSLNLNKAAAKIHFENESLIDDIKLEMKSHTSFAEYWLINN